MTKVGSEAQGQEAPKSEHGYRSLDIGPKVIAVLHACREEQEAERAAAPVWEDNDLAFTQDTYHHLLPGMGAAAARRFEDLVLGAEPGTDEREAERP